ncbi:response regulator transcription factor [Streptomyces sp. NPDC001848]|uniref:response regulator transcription factor n=1 Tax=Streptomyces sp. NPDC001848 TaxID=3364618 RepID=UPI0036B381EE
MSGSARTTVLLVDSHPISLTGLRTILEQFPDLQVVGDAPDGDTAATRYRQLRPDVVVINSHTGTDAAQAVRRVGALAGAEPPLPAAPTMLVLLNDTAAADRVRLPGVKGLLSSRSGSQELAAAVRIMATGRSLLIPTARPGPENSPLEKLTVREVEVFRLITRGYTNAEISAELTLSQSTVKSHIQKVMEKLGLRNRVHAVIFAYEQNIIHSGS